MPDFIHKPVKPPPRKRPWVGLALGSGAARGGAHIGVLKALEENGIRVDMITGTSAGAVVGALYAQGRSPDDIRDIALELSRKALGLVDPSLPVTGLIKGKKIQELLRYYIGKDYAFRELRVPFACLATDILSGEEIVFDGGPVVEALRASISVPVIFTAVKIAGRYMVDGVLVNPVPVSTLKNMGADFIIAVNVIPPVGKQAPGRRVRPGMFHIMMQSIYIGAYSLVRTCLSEADVVIEPELAYGPGDFHHIRQIIQAGEAAARQSIPEINRKLAELKNRKKARQTIG
ncbi:MAG: patatin-like phospholipase family protein [Chloroflexi bacterium]|nr:patatin-like phospholipase family protein [Chloroflexota bacterium]